MESQKYVNCDKLYYFSLWTKCGEWDICEDMILPSDYAWWFPVNADFSVIDQLAKDGNFPSFAGLWPAAVYCVLFGIARMILQRILFTPLATWSMKLKYHPEVKELNKDIDVLLKQKKGKQRNPVTADQIQSIASKHSSPVNEVRKAIVARRHNRSNDLKLVKFSEALWRFMFYVAFVVLGYYTLFVPETAVWVRDTKKHFENWPHIPIPEIMRTYYLIELGSYFHQLMWTEVTRSDAAEMIIHHLATILLIASSYLTNYARIGASIMLCHDAADIFLEGGKLFNYASRVKEFKPVCQVITDTAFACFAVTFFVTRLILYPRYMVYSFLVESPPFLGGVSLNYYCTGGLLVVLQCLHIFWFYLISRMIVKLFSGGIKKDERSDDEEDDEEEEDVAQEGEKVHPDAAKDKKTNKKKKN